MSKAGKLFTIGVYGWSDESFFEALARSEIDVLVDVRARRGVRGAEYSFANRRRLEAELARRGITYSHFLQLSPSAEMRAAQFAIDKATGTRKRNRQTLSRSFENAYRRDIIGSLSMDGLISDLAEVGTRPRSSVSKATLGRAIALSLLRH